MDEVMTPFRIALLNSVFRILTILVLAPFISKIEKLVFILIKDTEEDNEEQADFDLLEERFLNYPPLAISEPACSQWNGKECTEKYHAGFCTAL